LLDAIRAKLRPFDDVMSQGWFRRANALELPRLTDFFSPQRAEKIVAEKLGRGQPTALGDRVPDEKFHLLLSPSLFLPDLAYYREAAGQRRVPVSVAFIDIDNFKALNTKYRHERIDRDFLPLFMRTLEAHVFGRGHAYRQGGDEYLAILPNAGQQEALQILAGFQRRLTDVPYPGIEERPTVSIGFMVIDQDSCLTSSEARGYANAAAAFAKEQQGKGCIATAEDHSAFRGDFIVISRPH
jgi:diguanylate cyclase (GGDEF)-like protein